MSALSSFPALPTPASAQIGTTGTARTDTVVSARHVPHRVFDSRRGDLSGHGAQVTPEEADALLNGAFHSDRGLGTAQRVRRRLPNAKVVVVSFVPSADLDTVDGAARRNQGDWIVFTLDRD